MRSRRVWRERKLTTSSLGQACLATAHGGIRRGSRSPVPMVLVAVMRLDEGRSVGLDLKRAGQWPPPWPPEASIALRCASTTLSAMCDGTSW